MTSGDERDLGAGGHTFGAGRIRAEDRQLVDRLKAGDETAFTQVVDHYGAAMRGVALCHVSSRAVADEVVQEAWLGVLTSLHLFEGRSSLRTWIMSILKHKAQTRARKERPVIPFSSLARDEATNDGPSVSRDRFSRRGERWPGQWVSPPHDFNEHPEHRFLARETFESATRSIGSLPPAQRTVIVLRDVHGWGSAEVCEHLAITEANQRVLLHRARSKVRAALEAYFGEAPATSRR
jgi:RNA polymerase sigma-70 factor, ECF subfamily